MPGRSQTEKFRRVQISKKNEAKVSLDIAPTHKHRKKMSGLHRKELRQIPACVSLLKFRVGRDRASGQARFRADADL